jgi:hypothetical protein
MLVLVNLEHNDLGVLVEDEVDPGKRAPEAAKGDVMLALEWEPGLGQKLGDPLFLALPLLLALGGVVEIVVSLEIVASRKSCVTVGVGAYVRPDIRMSALVQPQCVASRELCITARGCALERSFIIMGPCVCR